MANQETFNLLQFQERFATEKACQDYLFSMKWPNGYRCPKCNHDHYFKTKTRKLKLYECKECRYQTTVTVDTIMEKTRTALRKWFWAIFLVAHDKRGVSATFLAKELSISYKTAWHMLHKIRIAMGQRDDSYKLAGIVELDDVFFGAPTEGGKRGRGTEKTKVLVGLSLNEKNHPLFIKMKVIPDVKSKTLIDFANKSIKDGSSINSDAYHSYKSLAKKGFQIEVKKFNPKTDPDHLKWLHTIVSNAKAFIGGTFHGLDSKYLQFYLNEFSYRFNRRNFKSNIFNRLLFCCVFTKPIFYSELRI